MCKLVQTVSSKKCRESEHKSPTRWPEARFEVMQPQVSEENTALLRTGTEHQLSWWETDLAVGMKLVRKQVFILIIMLVKNPALKVLFFRKR